MEIKKLGEEVKEGDFVELPSGDRGRVLEIVEDGIMVMNFNEERRIRQESYKKEKCYCCNKKYPRKDLFQEKDGRYKYRGCINEELRKEELIF